MSFNLNNSCDRAALVSALTLRGIDTVNAAQIGEVQAVSPGVFAYTLPGGVTLITARCGIVPKTQSGDSLEVVTEAFARMYGECSQGDRERYTLATLARMKAEAPHAH